MKLITGLRPYGRAMMRKTVLDYLNLLIRCEGYKKVTIFGSGNGGVQLRHHMPDIEFQLIDYDPYLTDEEYECKDCIFDDIDVQGEVIITLHAEKMYPPHLKYPDYPHVGVLDTIVHNGSCTFEPPEDAYEIQPFDKRWLVYSI